MKKIYKIISRIMMKTLYHIIIFLFCYSCTNNKLEHSTIAVINEELKEYVREKEVKFDNLLCINKVKIVDSLLLLIDRCDSCIFHVYNMNQDSILHSFGNSGQGPDDFIYPLFLNNVNNRDSIFCYDTGLGRLKVMDKKECINSNPVKTVSKTIPLQLLASPDLSKENFGYIGCTDTEGKGLYFKYIENMDTIIWIPYPQSIQCSTRTAGNGNRLTSNDSIQRIAISTRYHNKLFLYGYDGKILKEIQIGKDKIYPQIDSKQKRPNKESILCNLDIQSTHSYIYVLALYQPEKDIHKPNITSKIFVFDWNLNYITTYMLPYKAHSIDVDENTQKLIYLGNDNNEECIIGIISL